MSVPLAAEIFGDPVVDFDQGRHDRRVADEVERGRARRDAQRILDAEEREPVAIPIGLTLRERLALPRTETRWRIERWQPANSRVMLTAQYKSGKSTLVGNYLRSLVDAEPFLGRDFVTPVDGSVVLFDNEMADSQLTEWHRALGIERDDHIVVYPLRGCVSAFNILDRQVRARWACQLREHRGEVVILDCFRPLLDALGLDEHRDAGRLLVAFDELLKDAEVTDALVVHHMGHTNERARGDSRLLDWPDATWKLVRQDDDPASQRFVSAFGRDVSIEESALTYDDRTRVLTVAGGSRQDAKVSDALDAVVRLLTDSAEGLSVRSIQTALEESDHPRDQVRAAIKAGVRQGTIIAEDGPRGSKLHRLCERAELCEQRAAHGASECAAASIEAARSHTHPGGLKLVNGRTVEGGIRS